jgi:acyl-CoA thioesterase
MMKENSVSAEDLKKYFKNDIFARHVGIELVDVSEGWARAKMEIKEHHLNGVRLVHGGAIFTLADLAFAAAVNSRGRVAVAINCSIQFLKGVTGNVIYAEAHEESLNNTIASYTIKVTNESGEVISVFQGMAYRKSDSVDFFEKA